MGRRADVQSVLAQFLPGYLRTHRIDGRRYQVLNHLQRCRTAALGGFRLQCERCSETRSHYHACRDRHCPKCQRRAARRWSERQHAALLPVPYFHVVFTLPHALNPWIALHDAEFYHALFSAAWTTLDTFARDPRRGLGGRLGMTAVMHTWGENLSRHVHLHCLVPGGVWCDDGHWKPARGTWLFPVKALSRYFRGTLVGAVRQLATSGRLHRVTRAGEVDTVLDELMASEWVVYAKPCLTHEPDVVRYLARYTHRIAISDERILAVDDHTVRFTVRDHTNAAAHKTMTLDGEEFVRRYLQHILPKGLMRIRHFGFLANRCRRRALIQICAALETVGAALENGEPTIPFAGLPCPLCRDARMHIVASFAPYRDPGGGRSPFAQRA